MREIKCKHEWKIISTWGVNTFFIRRGCLKCDRMEDAKINPDEWKQHVPCQP